jgi:hypothetical protein
LDPENCGVHFVLCGCSFSWWLMAGASLF